MGFNKLYFHFHLFQAIFKISLFDIFMTHCLFGSVLFTFYIFVIFLAFLLIFSFISLWSEKTLSVISGFLWPIMVIYSGEHFICTWKKVYSAAVGCNILYMSVWSFLCKMWFKSSVYSLLSFWRNALLIVQIKVLKHSTVILLLLVSSSYLLVFA